MTTTEIFYVENIHCAGCINSIQNTLNTIPGVQGVNVYPIQKKVCVMGIGINRDILIKRLAKIGYPESGRNSFFRKIASFIACNSGKTAQQVN